MAVDDLIKEINEKKVKAVQDRLKKEKATSKYIDPKDKTVFYTPLHAAVRAKSPAIVDALLTAGADVTAVDNNDATPLHWAALVNEKDSVTIIESLLKKKAKVDALNKAKQQPLHAAAQQGATLVIAALAKISGISVEAMDPGFTPLMAAAKAGCMEAVDALLAAGAKLATQDAGGLTVLMQLVEAGSYKEARMLIEKGDCALDAVDKARGYSALMIACSADKPDIELVRNLLMKGASPDIQSSADKDTAIIWAITKKQNELAKLLIKHSKKIKAFNNKKESALTLALGSGDEELLAAVLATGPDLSNEGVQLMKSAMEGKNDGIAAELVKVLKPVQLNQLDLDFKNLIKAGLPKAALEYLKRFEEEHAGDHAVDDDGNTNMHIAIEVGASYDLCKELMKMGLGMDTANKAAGDTPMHVAARCGNVEACKALLEAGADPTKRNLKNKTPRSQPKIPDNTKDYLMDAEEEWKKRREQKKMDLWGAKLQATQTESAFGVRTV